MVKALSLLVLFMIVMQFSLRAQANSLDFDGIDDYVLCGNNPSVNISGNAITLEAWIYPTSFQPNVWQGTILRKEGAGANGYMLRVGASGQVNFAIGTGSFGQITSPAGVLSLNTWHHVAATYNGLAMNLYVDGVMVQSGNMTGNLGIASNPLYLGGNPSRPFPGRIDEVRIWNDTRTVTEIQNNMCNIANPASEPNLVLYYKFDQSTGTNLPDLAGVNNGTLMNMNNSDWVSGSCIPMTYQSSTVTQSNTSDVHLCDVDQKIIGIEIVTTGTFNPLDLTQVRVRTDGSTAPLTDLTNMDVFYTGNSSIFDPTPLFGSAAPAANGIDITISGSQSLLEGTNYFWLAYDINPGGAAGNVLDAVCNQITVDGSNFTPTQTSPSGSRTIEQCLYPGGVSVQPAVWIMANEGTTPASGTASLTNWENFGTNGNIVINGPPDFTSAGYNYNPTIHFNGDGNFLGISDLNYTSLFAVAELEDLNRTATHLNTYDRITFGSHPDQCLHGGLSGSTARLHHSAYAPEFQGAGVWAQNGLTTPFTTDYSGNHDILSAIGSSTVFANVLLGGQESNGGFNGRSRDWLGDVSEYLLFAGALTSNERERVETYLAIKYGKTLGTLASPKDYLATDNTVIWDASVNPQYHMDVIGIGRDDVEALLQKQSHTADDTTRIYLASLASSNAANVGSFPTDIAYVTIGHDGSQMCSTPASNAEMPTCVVGTRFEREWKVTKTNFSGAFNADFTVNTCANPALVSPNRLRLLVDDDGDFANGGTNCYFNGDGSGILISYNNPVITVTNVNNIHIGNNQTRYLTLALDGTPLNYTEGEIEEILEADSEDFAIISMYPNPASNHLTLLIGSDLDTDIRVEVINQLGQLVLNSHHALVQGQNKLPIDLSQFASGVYQIRAISHNGQVAHGKFNRQ